MAESQQHEPSAGDATIRLYDEGTGEPLMDITPEQLRRLQDALEEEFPEDHDYYINLETLDYLFARGVDACIVDRFREAMGARNGFDVLWRAMDQPPDDLASGSGSPKAQR
jgi:hypothetical protein